MLGVYINIKWYNLWFFFTAVVVVLLDVCESFWGQQHYIWMNHFTIKFSADVFIYMFILSEMIKYHILLRYISKICIFALAPIKWQIKRKFQLCFFFILDHKYFYVLPRLCVSLMRQKQINIVWVHLRTCTPVAAPPSLQRSPRWQREREGERAENDALRASVSARSLTHSFTSPNGLERC